MALKPFLKWAGGKRWLVERKLLNLDMRGTRYIEPFLGGGAVFFHTSPEQAILSDVNTRLIETYEAIRSDPHLVYKLLSDHAQRHNSDYYYTTRTTEYGTLLERAAQFLYLNRSCWNGLYRENTRGQFNVPIGSKTQLLFPNDDFTSASELLKRAKLVSCDFEETVDLASENDTLFVDPPYTTAHNTNGFVKYNQKMFSWDDQVRLKDALVRAARRGARIFLTNADHDSIRELYRSEAEPVPLNRYSVIAGDSSMRKKTTEAMYMIGRHVNA
ncbi:MULTISPECIES: DNA adenine methylase [unclassified Aureimonas]|uniref:DNA adenine methylase n=1 Tax=unclassified Aureimonas TaxID=2615206 RepID=UPI0009E664F0|nr:MULTISPECIES: Dam family site-specific DNA-(adenine-N6)-methyltransferase [unclassified Aureimonas]